MRKLPWALLLIVAVVLALAAAGCGGDDDSTDTSGTPSASGTEGGTGGEKISVGMVSDTGGLTDRGFNEFSINGFERAQTELGVEGRVYTSKSADDY
jgi:basic membrane protein A